MQNPSRAEFYEIRESGSPPQKASPRRPHANSYELPLGTKLLAGRAVMSATETRTFNLKG